MTRSRIWTLGAIVAVVAILAGGWFLLVSPTQAQATDIQEQTASQEQANTQLASQIEQLKVQSQNLPEQEAKIAEFRQRIPATPQLPAFIRDLSSIANSADVVLVGLEPQTPQTLAVQVTGSTSAPSGDATTDPAAVTLGTTVPSNVQFVQAKVTVAGGYFNTEQFVAKLEKLQRSFLVTGFDISDDKEPSAQAGDVVTNLQVRVFFASNLTAPPSSGVATLPSTTPAN